MRYEGSPIGYDVLRLRDVMVPARDGIRLATDLYLPARGGQQAPGRFPTLLERTPYDKNAPGMAGNGRYFARRGYVCAVQDVRGRFASEGEWYPFAHEAPDGFDAVEWLAGQEWSDGQVGTMGGSYSGSDQSALATLNPPHLRTMVVAVGASNYHHCSMRHNGALEQRFLVYAFRMATTSKEALADPGLRAALKGAHERVGEWVARAPLRAGASPLRLLPSYERWVLDLFAHGDYDDYWRQRGYAISDYYEQHADVPTLYLGGWYDSYARATCENYVALSRMKRSRQVLLMGPWTHSGWGVSYAGDVDFGPEAPLEYNDLRLAWFDHFLKGLPTQVAEWAPVRLFVMGAGDGEASDGRPNYEGRLRHGGVWRDAPDYPLPGARDVPYYLQPAGGLSPEEPPPGVPPARYSFDPRDPVPTIGGGISAADGVMRAGAFDQRGRAEFFGCRDTLPLSARADVLTFQTAPLERALEVTGPVRVTLYAASSARDTDWTAKLIDVHPPSGDYPEGLAINLTDSILRARYREGWEQPRLLEPGQVYPFTFELYPTSNVFRVGHRIRLDVSSSNFPRFDVNPNTGGEPGLERRTEVAQQEVYLDREHPSHVVLPVVEAE